MGQRHPHVRRPTRRGAMSRYDDPDEADDSRSSWEQPRQDGASTPVRRGPHKRRVLAIGAIAATILVVGTSLAAYAKYRNVLGSIKRVDVSAAERGKLRPFDTAALNILV